MAEQMNNKIGEGYTENQQKHLNHDFYKRVEKFLNEVRKGQILYGAEKYDEPFNPKSWTAKELLTHAMQEIVDETHYLFGLFELVEEMEKEKRDFITLEKNYDHLYDQHQQLKIRLSRFVELENRCETLESENLKLRTELENAKNKNDILYITIGALCKAISEQNEKK